MDILTLKMTFNYKNSSRNGLFVNITLRRRSTLFAIYVFKLHFDDLELKLILKITFNHSNNTIIGFVNQNPIKRGITQIPSFIC